MTTDQENLWAGEFGDDYANRQAIRLENNVEFFERALDDVERIGGFRDGKWVNNGSISSVIEFGAGTGENLRALKEMIRDIRTVGVEINPTSCQVLGEHADSTHEGSILTFHTAEQWDLVLTKGLLIHVAPPNLPRAYDTLYQACGRYLLIAEYYSPRLESVPYRGQDNALWKGPYADQLLDRFTDLKCIDYGWVWHRDEYPQDDLTWFLMERT